MQNVRELPRRCLVVSCQAEPDEPLHGSETMAKMAKAAVMAGAKGIRANTPEDVAAIREVVDVPIIGIKKDRSLKGAFITVRKRDVDELVRAGADYVAIDSTRRERPERLEDLFGYIRRKYPGVGIIADIADSEDAFRVAKLKPDFISTTLSGYTEYSKNRPKPDILLVEELSKKLDIPILAEGNYKSPEHVRMAILRGAHAVVVGSYITRPQVIARDFSSALKDLEGMTKVLGVDIGGSFIRFVLLDRNFRIVHRGKFENPHTPERILWFILEKLKEFGEVSHMGIASAGMVDPKSGRVVFSNENIPGWSGTDIKSFFKEKFKGVLYVDNDVNAAAVAQWWKSREKSMFLIQIGTGVGGAYIENGKILRGKRGGAGEVGYIRYPRTLSDNLMDFKMIEELLRGDSLKELFDRCGDRGLKEYSSILGWLLLTAKSLYDFEKAYIGGVVLKYGEKLLEYVRDIYVSLSQGSDREEIEFYQQGEMGGALGAALSVLIWGGMNE